MLSDVAQDEELVRGVFSSKQVGKARRNNFIAYKIFLEKAGSREISVDRYTLATPEKAAAIAREVAKNRGADRQFYGWAVITAEKAAENNRRVCASPMEENPYHADIILPGDANDIEYEEQIKHAQELALHSRWQAPPD